MTTSLLSQPTPQIVVPKTTQLLSLGEFTSCEE